MIEYYERPEISQSWLKSFRNPNPRSLYRGGLQEDYYYIREKVHFSKGKLLDVLLEGIDPNEWFYVEAPDYKRPTEVVESIAQQCVDENINPDNFEQYSRIAEIKAEHDYQNRWKEKTTVNWIQKTLSPIIKNKQAIGNRTVITHEEYIEIATMATSILEGEFTKPILDEYKGEFQVAIYCDGLKGLIDYLQIDHVNKTFRVIDFKTTSDYLELFPKSIKKYGYDIQLSFYSYLVQCQYPDYKMLEPVLLVSSTREPNYAEPFTLSYKVIDNAMNGWTDIYGRSYKGWKELLLLAKNYNQELYNKELITTGTNYINEL